MDGLRITISPLFSLNLGYPLRFMQGFYNFQDSQNIKLGQNSPNEPLISTSFK